MQTKEIMLSNGFIMVTATDCCGQLREEEVCLSQKGSHGREKYIPCKSKTSYGGSSYYFSVASPQV